MPQTPKQKDEIEDEEKDPGEKASWGKDQQERGYYYDDSHGYEIYDPDEEEKDDD